MSGVEYPVNDFTRMIEMTSRINAAGGMASSAATGEPPPAVQSAVMRQPQPVEEEMSAEERAALDREAIAAGVVDPRLGNAPGQTGEAVPSQDQYANMTMEEVLAAGAPVPMTRQKGSTPTGRVQGALANRSLPGPARMVVPAPPRLPNFRNVQGFDLISGEVLVDDMAFKIPGEDLAEYRLRAVEIARECIMNQLEEALDLFTPGTAEVEDGGIAGTQGENAAVQPVAEGDRTEPTV